MKITNMNYEEPLSNPNSKQFQDAATKIESEVLEAIRIRLKDVVAIKVKTFSGDKDNLVVNLIVVMDKDFAGDSNTTSEIAKEIAEGKFATLVPDKDFDVTVKG